MDALVNAKPKHAESLAAEESILNADSRWRLAERAARSSVLARATQLRDILLFIVRHAILAPEEPIREFEIAHQVLGRRSDFNPLDDNIVRVQMAHLRKKLDLHFSTEGQNEDVIITIALGSYRPIFRSRDKGTRESTGSEKSGDSHLANSPAEGPPRITATHSEILAAEAAQTGTKRLPHSWSFPAFVTTGLIALALAGACIALWVQGRNRQQALDAAQSELTPWKQGAGIKAFWSSFLNSSHDTDLVLSDDSLLLIEQIEKRMTTFPSYLNHSYIENSQAAESDPKVRFVDGLLATKTLGNTSEFLLAQRLMALDPLGKKIHLYSARQYMPELVKQDNVILIGGVISNPWGEIFESRLNFIEETKFEGYGLTVVKNTKPAEGEPSSYVSSDSIGYCVVAFMPNPGGDGKVLLIEGTSSEATAAAGDFLLSEDRISGFRNKIHSTGFPYFEILLKTSQVRGTPLNASIEAYRVYTDMQ
jgi:hypothetical protein